MGRGRRREWRLRRLLIEGVPACEKPSIAEPREERWICETADGGWDASLVLRLARLRPTSRLSFGLYGTIGKNPILTNAAVETARIYHDFDGAYTLGAAPFKGRFDLGHQTAGVANGGAMWHGGPLLANTRFTPRVGATLRHDYLKTKRTAATSSSSSTATVAPMALFQDRSPGATGRATTCRPRIVHSFQEARGGRGA